jgi:DUF4097 and DUF4098 domain-containing protein YvlB
MKLAVLVLLLAIPSLASNRIQIVKDGPEWSVTVSGALPPQPIMSIEAAGNLTVRGKRSKDIRYSITRKLAVADQAAARLVAGTLRVRDMDGQLIFEEPGGAQPGTVRVELPRASQFLALASAAGMIDASDIDGSVRADTAAGKITLDRIAGDVEIHSSGGTTSLGNIGGVVRCYSGGGSIRAVLIRGQSLFETGGGDIRLGEMLGAVRAFTGAGGIRIEQAGSQVYADTLGGPISILRAFGLVVANSSGGPIDIGDASSVRCRNASGTIRLSNVSGRLEAATDRGNIVAGILAGQPLADSFLSTRAGDITVFIPSNTSVRIDAEIHGSRNPRSIVSDYSGLRREIRSTSVAARGNIHAGRSEHMPTLRLTDEGGRIEILRK